LTLAERRDAFAQIYAKWPASWPWLVREQGRDVLYGVWVIGNDYRNKTRYYGAYPAGFLERVMALFPDVRAPRPLADGVLHVFSGSLPRGPYTRLDVNPALQPDFVGSVYDAGAILEGYHWPLVMADPPYSKADAVKYATPMIDRRRALAALADVTIAGGHLAWLDTVWPMHSKRQWLTVGRILIQRSTNHRARVLSLFERVA
jgi:hypothetical protein